MLVQGKSVGIIFNLIISKRNVEQKSMNGGLNRRESYV